MGAQSFMATGQGLTISAALQDAKNLTSALSGQCDTLYGGDVLTKDWAREITPPIDCQTADAIQQWATQLLHHADDTDLPEALSWIARKASPAAAVRLATDAATGEATWLFFGFAPC